MVTRRHHFQRSARQLQIQDRIVSRQSTCSSVKVCPRAWNSKSLFRPTVGILASATGTLDCLHLYCILLNCTLMYCTVLCCTLLNSTVLYSTVLYCTVKYSTVLYWTVLYRIQTPNFELLTPVPYKYIAGITWGGFKEEWSFRFYPLVPLSAPYLLHISISICPHVGCPVSIWPHFHMSTCRPLTPPRCRSAVASPLGPCSWPWFWPWGPAPCPPAPSRKGWKSPPARPCRTTGAAPSTD